MAHLGYHITELSEEVATAHSLPRRIETWCLNVVLALRNPQGYVEALSTINALDLFKELEMLDTLHRAASIDVEHFVPLKFGPQFIEQIEVMRGAIHCECAKRGFSIASVVGSNLN